MKIRNFEDSLRTNTSQMSMRYQQQDNIRDPPQKIRQNKFTKTYSKLQFIPLQKHIETLNPKSIEHLYISHNKIKSLAGIQEFQNLISLNVSYNLLTKIQELFFIQKPENILRIGLKMNDFIYGYQDFVVYFFKNLQKLDDIYVKDKLKVKRLQQQGDRVANLFLEFHIRVSRLFLFLDDLIKQQKLHEEMKLKRSSRIKINPKVKLLFEHMTENFISKISSIYVMPTQEEFLHLTTTQILNKIQQAIIFTLEEDIDLKCTCRPRKPFQQQVKDSFKQICFKFLNRFVLRYNNQLQNGLEKMNKKFSKKLKDKHQEWQLWGMLQNYRTLASGGKNYQDLTSTIGKNYVQFQTPIESQILAKSRKAKTKENQWRNKVFLSKQNSQNDKQNITPNIPHQPQQNSNFQNNQTGSIEIFYNRIPIILYEKNYVQVLLQITMEIIKEMLEKYDYLNKVRTNYFISLQKQKKEKQKRLSLDEIYNLTKENKSKSLKIQSQQISNQHKLAKHQEEIGSSMKETKRIETSRNNEHDQLANQQGQIFFKGTRVQNSPSDERDQLSARTTQRKLLKRQQSQISFGINKERDEDFQSQDIQSIRNQVVKQNNKQNKIKVKVKDYSIYEINLIYKVFRTFKIKVIKRKNKNKIKLTQV